MFHLIDYKVKQFFCPHSVHTTHGSLSDDYLLTKTLCFCPHNDDKYSFLDSTRIRPSHPFANTLPSTNELSGSIPTSLSNISALTDLEIYRNRVRGHIPLEFGAKLNHLSILSLWGNQLSGNIPNSIGNCSKLQLLFLDTIN
jgi:hypothetical protein